MHPNVGRGVGCGDSIWTRRSAAVHRMYFTRWIPMIYRRLPGLAFLPSTRME
jgi:hypothetical protein